MKYFAVTGKPILHSLSPDIFTYIFQQQNIDAKYLKLIANNPEEIVEMIKNLKLSGVNITSPFKQSIVPFLDELSDIAKETSSVNTVVVKDGKLTGYNTDYYGVVRSLAGVENKKILVLGGGGAAQTVVYSLSKQKNTEIFISNRTYEKAVAIAGKYGATALKLDDVNKYCNYVDIIINTVPNSVQLVDTECLSKDKTVFDAIYDNSVYEKLSKEIGFNFISGEQWLLNQAVESYKLFFDSDAEPDMSCFLFNKTVKEKIILIGFMGSGKSSVGKFLAEKLNCKLFSTDDIIQIKEGKSINEIFEQNGEAFFRDVENNILGMLSQMDGKGIVSTGGGVVLSPKNRELIAGNYLSIWLYADTQAIMERTNPENRPLLKNNFNAEFVGNLMNSRFDNYIQAADVVINTSNKPISEIENEILEELNRILS